MAKPPSNMSYKPDGLGVFAEASDSHQKVVESLLSKNFTVAWIAKSCGLPEADVRKIADAWRERRKK